MRRKYHDGNGTHHDNDVLVCRINFHLYILSYGDRQTISSLLRKLKQQSRDQIKSRKPGKGGFLGKISHDVTNILEFTIFFI